MNLIKQNDTSKTILLFMASSSAPTTGLTGATVTVRLSKNGAAFAAGAGTVAELEGGFYAYTPGAADTNTLGPLGIRATASGAVDYVAVRQVVAVDPYDAAAWGLSRLDAAVSSRSTYAGGAVASVTGNVGGIAGVTLPAAVPSLAQIQGGLPTDTSIATDVQTGLTNQGYTTARAGFLDTLNGLVAAIWAAATRTLTAIANVTVGGYAAGQDPATLVLDTAASGHNAAGSIGAKINSGGGGGGGGTTGGYTVPLRIRDAGTSANLVGVLVSVYDSTGTTLQDQKRTDGTGTATFSLNAATYVVRVTPAVGYGSLADQSLTITGNTALTTYTLTAISIANASPASTVTLYGYEYQSDGATPVPGRSVSVALTGAPASAGNALLESTPRTLTTDATGYWSAALVRGKTYRVHIREAGIDKTILASTDGTVLSLNIKDA